MATALNDMDSETVDQLGEKLGRLKNDFKEILHLASDNLAGFKDYAVDGGKAAASRVTATIEENPVRSTIIAVGVGALIGFLVSRR